MKTKPKISKRLNNIMNEFFKYVPNEYSDEERLDRFSFALLFLMLDEKDDVYHTIVFDKFWILSLLDDMAKTSKINKKCNFKSYIKDLDVLKPYLAANAFKIYFLRRTTNALFFIPFDLQFLYAVINFETEYSSLIPNPKYSGLDERNNIKTRFKEHFLYDQKEDGFFRKVK